ncbi:MAG: peptide chain release factor N(5)-glutamine methyltransferase [Bryobacterales bacterium]|nr:peptide chain release factor N(5)-glutamine methyltransferase [Bryobacterales bacterium]
MTLQTALAQGAKLLNEAGVAVPRLTAEVLLAHALRQERIYLVAHANDELTELAWIHYGRYLHEKIRGKPTQYITRRQEFYGRDFYVAPGVLIPRPETELLVEAVLNRTQPGARILDIGTGSGCIAITVAKESDARVYTTDISATALSIAQRNATTHGAIVQLTRADLASAFPDQCFDIVISNPPYIPEADRKNLAKEVRDHEPASALFAGADGLDIYRRLIPEALRVLKPGGLLALEFGVNQSESVTQLLSAWHAIEILPDLSQIPRIALALRPHRSHPPSVPSFSYDIR